MHVRWQGGGEAAWLGSTVVCKLVGTAELHCIHGVGTV